MIRHYIEENGIVKGFLGVNVVDGNAHLQHFYVDKPYRNINIARDLIKMFVRIVRELGHTTAFIHSCCREQDRLIEYYFREKPYGYSEGIMWYRVNIGEK